MGSHRFGHGKELPRPFVRDVLSEATATEVAARWNMLRTNVYYWRRKLTPAQALTTNTARVEVDHG